ncbi:MAG: ATP-binding protein [Planctomycetota bacterium]
MMDLDDVKALIAAGESDTCEWKKSSSQLSRAGETLCAFLNGGGGTVLLGVGPTGKLLGQTVSDKTLRDIAHTLARIQPHASVVVEEIPLKDDLKVIALKTSPDPNHQPYLYDGRPYQRSGPTTAHMPPDLLYRQVLSRPENENLWEGRIAAGFSMANLDREEIIRAGHRGAAALGVPVDLKNSPEEILRGFDLLAEDGHIWNAAMALFAKPLSSGPRLFQCLLQLALFKGTDKMEFLDQKNVEGGAFNMLSEAELFIRRHMPVAAKITPRQFEREETPLLPWDAVREALINALIHRDYADQGRSITVAIYDDRLEIWNPGRLPAGIELEQLKKKHDSVRRNRRIADAFHRTGLIEKWGRGTQTMVALCKDMGRAEPIFEERQQSFGVIFPAPFKATKIVTSISLTPLQNEILARLKSAQAISLRQAMEETGAARRTVQRALSALVKAGHLVGEGASQHRVYRRV